MTTRDGAGRFRADGWRLFLLIAIVLAVASPDVVLVRASIQPPGEFIRNGELSTLAEWTPRYGVFAQDGYAELVGPAQIDQLRLQLAGNTTDPRLLPGLVYSLEFQARATQPIAIKVGLFYYHPDNPDGDYRWWPPMRMTIEGTGWLTYRATFSPSPFDPDRPLTGIYFQIGGGATVGLDKVSIRATPPIDYTGGVLDLGTFEPDHDYWHVEESLPDIVPALSGGHELRLSLPPNAAAFAYRFLSLDIKQLGWDLELSVRTSKPENVGRMYVLLRSGMTGDDFVYHSFSGLATGTNVIKVGSERTTFSLNDPDPDCALDVPDTCGVPDGCVNQNDLGIGTGRVCDLYTWWFARDGFSWSDISTVAIKLETNSNGSPGATTDVYVDDVRLVRWTATPPPPTRRPPVVSRAHVKEVPLADGTTDPTRALIRWQTDQAAGSVVEYGLAPGSYPSSSGNPAESTRFHEVLLQGLTAGTKYHMRVVSQAAGGPAGRSGEFTFASAPSPPLVAGSPGAGFPVGLGSVPRPEDQPMAVDSGFNTLLSYLSEGGCEAPPLACPTNEVAVARNYLNGAAGLGVRAIVKVFCDTTIQSATRSPFDPIPGCPDPDCPPPPPGCTHCEPECPEVDYVTAKVKAIRQHPGFYGYYLLDEPELNDPGGQFLGLYDQVANAIDVLDPAHDVVMGSTRVSNNAFLPVVETVLLDNYPSFPERVEEVIGELAAAEASGKPFQQVVQAYSSELDRSIPIGRTPSRYPSEREMRVMAYLGIVYGSRGTWFHAMSEIAPFPGTEWNWTELSNVARSLRRLEPVLASRTDPAPYAVHPALTSGCCVHLHARINVHQGVPYLFTVNSNDPALPTAPETCDENECSLPGTAQATIALPYADLTAVALGEGRPPLTTGPAGLTDTWNPKDVHVYRLEDRAPPTATITFPADGARLRKGSSYTIRAAATDNVGVQRLEIWIDGQKVASPTFAPPGRNVEATYVWVATKGPHTIQAFSYDGSSNQGSSAIVNVSAK